MKKLTLFATALAAVFAVSSCSNDELEPIVEKKGTPLSITVSSTRGANTATDDLTSLNLTAIQNGASTPWADNVKFTKSGTWSTTGTANWPTTNMETASKFYVISENATGATSYSTTNVTDYLTSGTTFNYTVPDPAFSGSPITETAQPDLLVATAEQTEGNVALELQHALANIQIKAALPTKFYNAGWATTKVPVGSIYKIKKITIKNLFTSGTYDYANTTTPWSTTGSRTDIEIALPTPITVTAVDPTPNLEQSDPNYGKIKEDAYVTIVGEDARIRVIPQNISVWTPSTTTPVSSITNETYMEVEAFCFKSDSKDDDGFYDSDAYFNTEPTSEMNPSDDEYFMTVYIPIKISGNAFKPNTNHTFKINLINTYKANGNRALQGIQIVGQ